jgi:FkbM family methyltransferase
MQSPSFTGIGKIQQRTIKSRNLAEFSINGVEVSVPDRFLTGKLRAAMQSGRYENQEARAAEVHLSSGDRVLELGAGIGYVSTICAQIIGAKNVFVVEANPDLIPIIQATHKANDVAEVEVVHAAVVSEPTDAVEFFLAPGFWASSLKESGNDRERKVSVPAETLEELAAKYAPTVLIADLEGAEDGLFARPVNDALKLIVIEIHPDRYGEAGIGRVFADLAKQGFVYKPWGSRGAVVCFSRNA